MTNTEFRNLSREQRAALAIGPRPPTLPAKAGNLAGAAFRIAKATMKGEKVVAAASEIERRLAICRRCEFFRDSPVMHCLKCGCVLNLKMRLETEHCPINKW